jgi:hypothetical protein
MTETNDVHGLPGGRGAPPDVDLDRVWRRVATAVWRREPGRLERTATRLLGSPGLARALLTTPSLLVPWLLSTVLLLVGGVGATEGTGQPMVGLLAPVLTAVGIAYAYGPGVDPAWELMRSMAVSDRMVLMVRAVAVLTVNAALGLSASAASGVAAELTFGWLLPMLAVSALSLAVATVTTSAIAGAAAGLAAWMGTVLTTGSATGSYSAALTSSGLVLPYLLVAALGCLVVRYATKNPRRNT